MLLGLLPALHQALHSRLLLSLSFHTNSRAAANGTMELRLAARLAIRLAVRLTVRLAVRRTLEYPSQSCTEIQPASLYITCGEPGTLEGRCSDLLQVLHSCLLLNLHLRTIVRAASKGRKARMRCPPRHFAKLASVPPFKGPRSAVEARMRSPARPFADLVLVPPSKGPRSAVGSVPWACHLHAAAQS